MDTDERLQRIESDIHEMKADMSDIKVNVARITATIESTFPHLATKESVAKIETTIESTLPHVATKAEVEEAKHEATKGKYGLPIGTLVTRFIGE